MAAKTGQAIKHNAPRGRELSGTHDYQQRRQSSGKKVLTSQEERPWLFSSSRSMLPEQLQRSGKKVLTSQEEYPWSFSSNRSMLPDQLQPSGQGRVRSKEEEHPRFFSSSRTMLPEQLSRPGQGRVRSKVQYKIPNYDLFGANSSNRSSPQYLSRSHDQHLLDRASSSSTHVQVSKGQATSVLFPGEHKEQGTASIFCAGASSTHGQDGFSSKQLSKCQEQDLSRSQRQLRYSTSQDISKSQVQPWFSSQQLISTTSQNQDSQATGNPGHIRVDVNVILHASPGLKEVFSSTQQQRGPLANIGAMMDEIYNLLRGK